ncbi:hypothetical protein GQ457_15G005090 [Hibiscus cannabinus]
MPEFYGNPAVNAKKIPSLIRCQIAALRLYQSKACGHQILHPHSNTSRVQSTRHQPDHSGGAKAKPIADARVIHNREWQKKIQIQSTPTPQREGEETEWRIYCERFCLLSSVVGFPFRLRRAVKGRLIRGFMSAEFDLALIGAQLQLCFSSSSTTVCARLFFTALLAVSCMILCFSRQRLNLVFPAVSMRLRPKKTCSGVECFGGFHIKQRVFYLFLFLRGAHT